MKIRDELQALIAFIKCEHPTLSDFVGYVSSELENVTDEQLEYYVDNDLDLWGILNLLVMNSIELNIEYNTAFLEQVLFIARRDYLKKESETAH
ncbi:hypothetical protein [Vibrio sp. MED222]|uniref:hypothetical protein n=1 Tax=Vibrio sp. MED222 TaxID=314290 RepID=UPI000068EC56|nr:hypothetical protein [Vibrio sp. MED222]EAQ55519.1 hypothetical protein MED222_08863 [Vibrio sp. MED222]